VERSRCDCEPDSAVALAVVYAPQIKRRFARPRTLSSSPLTSPPLDSLEEKYRSAEEMLEGALATFGLIETTKICVQKLRSVLGPGYYRVRDPSRKGVFLRQNGL